MRTLRLRSFSTVVAAICTLSWLASRSQAAEAPIIGNAGFESGLTGWTEIEPVTSSTVAHTGERSAKLSSTTGRIKRVITGLTPGTGYILSGWVLGSARLGVRNHGGNEVSAGKSSTSWTKASVTFTTGASNTSAEIYGAWTSGSYARVDDFALAFAPAAEITPSASRVTASTSDATHLPAYAVDGTTYTHWSGLGNGAWLRLDLGSVKTVSHAKVAIYHGSSRRAKFDLQVSTDGSTWKTVWSGSSSGTTSGLQTYQFADVPARYVRYLGHGYISSTLSSLWNSVNELEIYGYGSTSTTVATTDVPGDVLDLTNWKLQLPLGSEGSVTEIKQPQLATYQLSPWFRLDSAGDGVRFRAPTNAPTTSGSNYPRCELREMVGGGASKAAWSNTSGTHRMFIDQAITAVPRGKRHIVAGQIHDADEDIIVIRLQYPTLFIDIGGDNGPVLDADYALGQRFTVELVAEDGKVAIYYNGSTTPAYVLDKDISDSYFKAGAYTQSNCTTEADRGETCGTDNYGEVTIYDLRVDHD